VNAPRTITQLHKIKARIIIKPGTPLLEQLAQAIFAKVLQVGKEHLVGRGASEAK